ncbi:hypothetical protein [Specibacter cremeus]|uniref:hypothetical protein n=1 Tax=Specibacter cremeus TaxID=1629051 RepID=UPI000F78CCC5|nr:hypothetical protein [Specibacter cremeus]
MAAARQHVQADTELARDRPVSRVEDGFGRWANATLAAVLAGAWLSMAELDRLIGAAVTADGRAGTAAGLQGLSPGAGQQNWPAWRDLSSGLRGQVAGLLGIYALFDLLFAVAYITLFWRLFGRRHLVRTFLVLVMLAEFTESVCVWIGAVALAGARGLGGPGTALSALMVAATWVKWAALAGVVVALFAAPAVRARVFRGLRRTWQALFFQRISAAVLLIFAVLALLPIAGVNDQLPDTLRFWAGAGLGDGQFWWTTAAVAVVAIGLFSVGRRRSELAWNLFARKEAIPKHSPNYWWWTYGPGVLVAALLVVFVMGGTVNWPNFQFWFFLGLPLGLAAFSLVLRVLLGAGLPAVPGPADFGRALDVWRCGDLLATGFLAVAGLALVRSFTAPLSLGVAVPPGQAVDTGWSAFFLVLGWLLVLGAFPVGSILVRVVWDKALLPSRPPNDRTMAVSVAVTIGCALILGAFLFFPVAVSRTVGVVGTAILAVGSWAVVIGFLVVGMQHQRPLPLFERLGLRANPILSLIVLVLVVGSYNGGPPALHAVRQLTAGAPAPAAAGFQRQDLAGRFTQWLAGSGACTLPVGGNGAGVPGVRPLLLVAAAGGGIRAATWTVGAFGELAGAGACGGSAVFLSSGVSGGSLGLALTDLYGPGAGDKVARIADAQVLAADMAGLAVGDIVGSGAGLMAPTAFTDPATGLRQRTWNDRAGLMENLWQGQAPLLAGPFSGTVRGPAGALILNSTAANNGCRLLLSQLDLGNAIAPNVASDCSDARGRPVSIDLFGNGQCPLDLRWSTAAMLSARFPIVSPSGRIPAPGPRGCSEAAGYQAIDGGLSETSGLGTINDVWPQLAQLVLAHNTCVLAGAVPAAPACAATARDFVVPVIVYLQNAPAKDAIAAAPRELSELVVPVAGLQARAQQIAPQTWLQRLESSAGVCPLADTGGPCGRATDVVRQALNGRAVVVVAPDTVPALDPPLGWALSPMSQAQLAKAMAAAAAKRTGGGQAPGFGNLLELLGRAGH